MRTLAAYMRLEDRHGCNTKNSIDHETTGDSTERVFDARHLFCEPIPARWARRLVDWALDRVTFLDAPPAPRPAPRTEEDELLALELEYAAQEAAELETNGKK